MKRNAILFTLVIAICMIPAFAVGSTLVNGGFEAGNDGSWTLQGNAWIGNVATINTVEFTPVEGDTMAGLSYTATTGYAWENRIFQNIEVGPSDTTLTFAYNFWTMDEGTFDSFKVFYGDNEVLSKTAGDSAGISNDNWETAVIDIAPFYDPRVPGGAQTFGILFQAGNTGDDIAPSGVFIDNVQIVPIPTTLLLLGSGLIGLVGIRRKLVK